MNVRRNLLITALILILAGGVIFVFALSTVGFDFEKLGNRKMTSYELSPDEPFEYVSAVLNDCDLAIVPSPDGKTSLKIYAPEDAPVAMTVENGVMRIEHSAKTNRTRLISFFRTEAPFVTLYLPDDLNLSLTAVLTSGDVDLQVANRFGNVSIQTVSGDVAWNGDVEGQMFDFTTTSGDVNLTRISAAGLSVATVSGDIGIGVCTADGALSVGTTSGDTLLEDAEADTFLFHSESGDLRVSGASFNREINLSSVSGEMQLGDLVTEGLCQIGTTSGDVHFVRSGASRFDIGTVSGDVTGSLLGMEEEIRGDGSHTSSPGAAVEWKVETTSGYVHLFPEE
jgi:DUF4097 and DUF4098 domain-containing protein YvlB